tara:strand:- start:10 stop:1011 length:1002 start_codon:yes stop_codon:yes gene_type:complete
MISKINTYVIALLLLSFSFASEQRIAALGGNAGFWAEDDQNLYMFPATMHNFNLAQINVNDGASASFLFGEGTKYGFMMDAGTDNLINMAYGSGSWGLLLGLDLNSSESGDVKTSDNTIELGFGLNSGFGELGLGLYTFSSDDGDSETDDPSMMNIGFNLRREQSLWEFSHMLVSFNLTSSEQGEAKSSGMSLGLDLYRHWTLSETSDLLFAAGLKYNSMTNEPGGEADKEEETQIILPNFTFAVETNLLEWATVRAGVNNMHELNSTNKVGDTEVKTMGASEFDLAFGLGLEYGGFKLDLDLTPGFFVDPVSFITGFNDQALASQFSITYAW